MKKTIRLVLLSASLGAGAYAAPFMAIGDGAELFLTGTLGIRADDNIKLGSGSAASPEESDLIFEVAPGVDITFGKDAQMKGALTMWHSWTSYSDNSGLNTNLFNGDFLTRYDDGKLKLNFNVGYHELNQNTPELRGLVRRDVFTAGGNAEVEISQITAIGAGVSFQHENYKRGRPYTDSDTLTVPVDFFYKWTPKVDLSLGYRFRDHQVDIGSDSTDHFFNVGARGEFSPKFTGKVQVGITHRDLDGGGEDELLGLDASFAYEISPKTNLQFGASNDFGTSPTGQQQENLTLNGMITSKISEEWSVNFGLSWRSIDYAEVPGVLSSTVPPVRIGRVAARTDDFWEAQIGTTYVVNANVRLVGAYTFREYQTDIADGAFKNNVFSVSANFRY